MTPQQIKAAYLLPQDSPITPASNYGAGDLNLLIYRLREHGPCAVVLPYDESVFAFDSPFDAGVCWSCDAQHWARFGVRGLLASLCRCADHWHQLGQPYVWGPSIEYETTGLTISGPQGSELPPTGCTVRGPLDLLERIAKPGDVVLEVGARNPHLARIAVHLGCSYVGMTESAALHESLMVESDREWIDL